MQSKDELINKLEEKLESIGKGTSWLAERMTVSDATVRAWMKGEQQIPENKKLILEAFVQSGGGITKPQGESCRMLSPGDIIKRQ